MNTISSIKNALATNQTNVSAVVTHALDAAERLNPTLNAFLQIDRTGATQRAAELEAQATTDAALSLRGVPIAIKDNICTNGLQTSCGSQILGAYHPPYDATAIARLRAAGAVIIGKANQDEFAMGSSGENSSFGPTRNPWDVERVPGGSSSGSAAAVAAGIVSAALGSETGGSVRQPAAFCGIAGLKPTYGRISRYGLVAFASSLDNIGIFGRSCADIAAVLGVVAGRDPHDATSADVPVPDYVAELNADMRGVKIGVPREFLGEGLDAEMRQAIEQAIENYRALGASIIDIELPHAKYCIAVYYIIATAEASSNLARFDGVRYGVRTKAVGGLREMYRRTRDEGFGAEVKRRIMLGTYVLSSGYYEAYYAQAQKVRTLITQDFARAFQTCDAILTPTTPTPAFKLGEKTDDPLAMYLSDIYTATANLASIPGLSVPCGLSSDGLPLGVQLLGPQWSEATLLRLGHAYEQAHPLTAQPRIQA